METRRELLDKLYLSLEQSIMLGIQIQQSGGKKFYIALVEKIVDNEETGDAVIYLSPVDISGNRIDENPLPLQSISAVRVYEQLKGHLPVPTPGIS